MLEIRPKTLAFGAMVCLLSTAATAANVERPSAGVGQITNALVDSKVDQPLSKAKNVFDVYKVIIGWLAESYPKDGAAAKAIASFAELAQEKGAETPAAPDKKGRVRTIEMPMSIDQLMKILRAEAPGANGPIAEALKDNAKAQLFTAQLLPFLQMRGITFRIRPILEKSYALHSMGINTLRGNRHELSYNAGANAMAVFEWMTYPMAQKGRTPVQFKNISDVQAWIESEAIPTYDLSIKMAEKALETMGDGEFESVSLTNFLVGPNPFPQVGAKYGKAQVSGTVASMYATRAMLRAACLYNLDEVGEAGDRISNKMFKQFLSEKVKFNSPRTGNPSNVRYQAIEEYSSLGTLRNGEHGGAILADLRTAWKLGAASVQAAKGTLGQEHMQGFRFMSGSLEQFEKTLAPAIEELLGGVASVSDYSGGNPVEVDLPGFLSNPPSDLKSFLPNKFNLQSKYRVFKFSGKKLIYSNYDYGNPTGWKSDAADDGWRKLFPGISDETGADGGWIGPMRIYRDISRTPLGGVLGGAIGMVMN